MLVYSVMLAVGLVVASPWWLWRWGRYRAGLGERLGRVRAEVRAEVAGKDVVWVHAVSVGEVLAVERLVAAVRESLPGWVVCVSTTTATGQAIARARFAESPVFYFPLDFAFAVRAYVQVLRPKMLVLVEGELWPRVLEECARAGVPVVVVNARVSDRSYKRTQRLRGMWVRWLGGRIGLFLAQGEETAQRLRGLGVDRVKVVGNLKYETGAVAETEAVRSVRARLPEGARLVVCGSTLEGEEAMLLAAWPGIVKLQPKAVLLLAPRHPERFEAVAGLGAMVRVSGAEAVGYGGVMLLDSLGSLASVYGLGAVAFVGGSLNGRGGHNPLEPARFGVPVLMGSSYENFREIVEAMRRAEAIRIMPERSLAQAVLGMLFDGAAMGARGRRFCETQAGATDRTLVALLDLLKSERKTMGMTAGERRD